MVWVSSGVLQGLLSGFGFIEGTQAPDFDMGFSIFVSRTPVSVTTPERAPQ